MYPAMFEHAIYKEYAAGDVGGFVGWYENEEGEAIGYKDSDGNIVPRREPMEYHPTVLDYFDNQKVFRFQHPYQARLSDWTIHALEGDMDAALIRTRYFEQNEETASGANIDVPISLGKLLDILEKQA